VIKIDKNHHNHMTKLILHLIEDDFDFRCDIICDMVQNLYTLLL